MDRIKPTDLVIDKAIGAMLGAAYGDALGWPNERVRSSRYYNNTNRDPQEFIEWNRHAGGRFYSHEEIIQSGEYSDDTQLILCLSRCLNYGEKWWRRWTDIELPFWSLYERGGGGATKRAADAWIKGCKPWSARRKNKDTENYFSAGGNGVAMRVLPHILSLESTEDYGLVAKNIMLDGIATHGHPRALVGALAYGYSLWKSVKRNTRLEYGEIVEDLLDNINKWSALPDIYSYDEDWYLEAERHLKGYLNTWKETIREMEKALSICRLALSKGALAFEDETLKAFHCFDRRISGAGTVAAVAAIYLASRYAPDPVHGVVKAAHLVGSDTDTIASMTGGLLGTVNGSEWLSNIKDKIQDSSYLIKCAKYKSSHENSIYQRKMPSSINTKELKNWMDFLIVQPESTNIHLPDGRKGIVRILPDKLGKSGRFKVQFRRIDCEDEQSLIFKKISKCEIQESSTLQLRFNRHEILPKSNRLSFGVKIPVESFEKSIWFYEDILGLKIIKHSKEIVAFEQGLALIRKTYSQVEIKGAALCSLLFVEVANVEQRFSLIIEKGIQIHTPISKWRKSNRQYFRCYDFDGNIVEVFAKKSESDEILSLKE